MNDENKLILSDEERELILNFRKLPEKTRAAILKQIAKGIAPSKHFWAGYDKGRG
jgi:hypothetical protein